MPTEENWEREVVIFAPLGREGNLIEATIRKSGIFANALRTIEDLSYRIESGVGAVILTEEALSGASVDKLQKVLAGQPRWSDVPLIILTSGGETDSEFTWGLVRSLKASGNVSLLERPVRTLTMVSAAEVALRSRERQYEVRDMNEEL